MWRHVVNIIELHCLHKHKNHSYRLFFARIHFCHMHRWSFTFGFRGAKLVRPKGSSIEARRSSIMAQRAESVGGVLWRGQQAPPHQLDGLGSAVSSLSVVWGGAPAEIEFGAF